jgi:hypothetical protein
MEISSAIARSSGLAGTAAKLAGNLQTRTPENKSLNLK